MSKTCTKITKTEKSEHAFITSSSSLVRLPLPPPYINHHHHRLRLRRLMDIVPPPPPLILAGVPPTDIVYNNGGTTTNGVLHHRHSSPPSSSSPASPIIIVMIVIFSAIIASAIIYLLIRFFSHRSNSFFRIRTPFSPSNGVVSDNSTNENETHRHRHQTHHVIAIPNDNGLESSLPLFTYSSIAGKNAGGLGGDCAVCLSKFEGADQLRLLPLCCHAFHAQCIDAWLRSKSNQTCPLCRSTVNPTEADIANKIASGAGNRSNSLRIEIGTVSRRRDPSDSQQQRSYPVGSYEYVIDEGYEIPVESSHHQRGVSDSTTPEPPGENLAAEMAVGGGGGSRNWLRDYLDRVSVSLSSRRVSFRGGSGRFFTGSSRRSRRSETIDDFEASYGGYGEEISELFLFRWLRQA